MYSWSRNKDDELWNYGIFETIDDCIQEAAESWYISGRGDKNTEAWDDLQNGVNKLVLEYLEKISEKPGFFRIEDVHMVEIP